MYIHIAAAAVALLVAGQKDIFNCEIMLLVLTTFAFNKSNNVCSFFILVGWWLNMHMYMLPYILSPGFATLQCYHMFVEALTDIKASPFLFYFILFIIHF